MRTRVAGRCTVLVGVAAVFGGWLARPRAQPADTGPVFAPGPEVDGAAERGKADVAAAQRLARAGKVGEAVALLERVAAEHPSVVHDCNLALAYLRAGKLTRAQLVWDLSRLRGAAPPDWCDGSLSRQLASALRDRHFVPLTVSVAPAHAAVEVSGIRFRDLGLLWLAPGTYTAAATLPEHVAASVPVLVASPSAAVRITLVPVAVEPPPLEVDAGARAVPDVEVGDAAVEPGADASVVRMVEPPPPPPPAARPLWPTYAGAGVGVVALAAGAFFHARALGTKDRANELARDSTAFADERARFGDQRALAIGGYALSAAGFGLAVWWWSGRRDEGGDGAPTVGISVHEGGAAVTVGGSL